MLNKTILSLILICACLLMSGCGQKGPLYLPGKPPPARNKLP